MHGVNDGAGVSAATIPAELRELPQWVRWKAIPDEPKPRKIPIHQSDPRCASSTDPETWGPYDVALANVGQHGTCGIGFMFAPPYFGADLDNQVVNGVVTETAKAIVKDFSTYTEISPSGEGLHIIGGGSLNGHRGINRKVACPGGGETGVEVYDSGRFFATTGNHLYGTPLEIADCQVALDALVARLDPPRPAPLSTRPRRTEDHGKLVERARAYVAKMPPAISEHGGHDATFAVALTLVKGFLLDSDTALDLLREYNGRCEPPWTEKDLLHKIEDAGEADAEDGYIVERDPAPERRAPGDLVLSSWRDGLVWKPASKGKATALQNHIVNVTAILANDKRWAGCLSLNTFSQIVEFVKRPPHEPANGQWLPRPMRDADLTYIAGWLAESYRLMVSPNTAGLGAEAVADRNPHHPVRKYLDSLSWDGVERLSSWLEDFTGATSTTGSANYIRSVARAWMISAVARIYQPGCKADHVLILEGMTGIKKSTAFSVLGGEWFTDQVASLDTKDSNQGVQGVWIIELAELDAMSRHEVGRIKAFLTITSDRFRPPYGHVPMRYDRQCVFAGTVNHTDYLRDETGNRRFWPVRCADNRIDIPALTETRDQLWAEAVVAYRSGEIWWLEDERAAQAEQEDRMTIDPWENPVGVYLDQVVDDWGPLLRDRPHVTLDEIMKVLQIPLERRGLVEQRRIVSILKRRRWDRKYVWVVKPSSTEKGKRQWRYVASGSDGSSTVPVVLVVPLGPRICEREEGCMRITWTLRVPVEHWNQVEPRPVEGA